LDEDIQMDQLKNSSNISQNRAGFKAQAFISEAMECMVQSDKDFNIIYVNPAFEKLFGWRLQEVKGEKPDFLNADPKSTAIQNELYHSLANGKPYSRKGLTQKKDGSFFPCKYKVWPVFNDNQEIDSYLASITDLSEQNRIENRLLHLNQVLTAVRNINKILTVEKNKDRLLKKCCKILTRNRGYHNTWIALIDPIEEKDIELGLKISVLETYHNGFAGDFLLMQTFLKDGNIPPCARRVIFQGQLDTVAHPKNSCSDCPLIPTYKSRAAFTIQLKYRDRIYGWLSASIPVEYANDEEEHSLFTEIAGDISYAISSIENEEQKKELEKSYQMEEELNKNESRIRTKLNELLEARVDLDKMKLENFIDCEAVQSLMDDFYELTKIGVAVVDLQGKVLVAKGWQDICTKFHRLHPQTKKNCIESDTLLSSGVAQGKFKIYKCKNHLWDMATPIIIGGQHLGNLFLGQFFFEDEEPDIGLFREQAHQYGFNETEYLKAYQRIPRWSRKTVNDVMEFYCNLIGMIANLSYSQIKLSQITHELWENERRLLESQRTAKIGHVEFDIINHKIIWADIVYELYERDPKLGTLSYDEVMSLHEPEDVSLLKEKINEAIEQFKPYYLDLRVNLPSGKKKVHHAIGKPLKNQEGKVTKIIGTIQDVTGRKIIEQSIQERNRKLNFIIEGAHLGTWVWNVQTNETQFNDTWAEMIGYSIEELMPYDYHTWRRLVHPDDIDEASRLLDECVQGKKSQYESEHRMRHKQGHWVWLLDRGCIMTYDDSGKPLLMFGTHTDISKLKNTEQELQHKKAELEHVFEAIPDAIIYADTDRNIMRVNKGFTRIFGYHPDEVLGNKTQLLYADYEDFLEQGKERYHANAKDHFDPFEVNYRKKNGEIFPSETIGTPVRNAQGKSVGLLALIRDITERKRIEKELHDNQAFLQAALDNSQAGIIIADAPVGKLRYVNDAALKISGKPKKEVVEGVGIQKYVESWEICHFDGTPYRDDEVPLARTILYNETCSEELIVKRPDGEERTVWANAAPIEDRNGKTIAGIVIFLDITETKKLNERLRQAEKMEAIGTLAGGIAHDFNNILAGIIGYADMSLDEVEPNSQLAENLEVILKSSDRAKNLVKQILDFSRKEREDKTPQYLKPVIQEVVDLLRATLPSSIQIISHLVQDKKPILANATQIHEVLMNLCSNAAFAMENEKGVLKILYEESKFDQPIHGRTGSVPPGEYSIITVADNGCGMDAKTLEHLFEPFFTTKQQGKGTGMGLAVLFGIVQNHKGTIQVQSAPGQGATFKVFLPKCSKNLLDSDKKDSQFYARGDETILFVDDEKIMGELVKKMLISLGYTVKVFKDPKQALEVFSQSKEEFDLIITDQTMPNLSGMELIEQVRKIRKDIPVLLSTGYSKIVDEDKALAAGVNAFLSKPFRKKILSEKIRKVLDSRTKKSKKI